MHGIPMMPMKCNVADNGPVMMLLATVGLYRGIEWGPRTNREHDTKIRCQSGVIMVSIAPQGRVMVKQRKEHSNALTGVLEDKEEFAEPEYGHAHTVRAGNEVTISPGLVWIMMGLDQVSSIEVYEVR